ncbi:monovalent cation/H+ antiporter complex subunit F [Lipingzhangella sp. LS1_29]|uniref:Monovalent cation/H+ antiporter complex subunit F n=2 Tax=Lipingzhangella rawalii TaxID=2055835 RepID=A0ABU2H3J7_9ACTN|nr:monovalent cation/H+ antiporter complex subunit F [Lipingzhangella rawalii]MDS1269877.1 monovalent cation/H+ antiporter complex subunit F [Lipingzhangella rawalii]
MVLLTAAALLALARIALGPSILDRAISLDVLVAVAIAGLGTFAAFHRDPGPLPILLVLSLVGFVGSVSVARFVARRVPPRTGHPDDPGSTTGTPPGAGGPGDQDGGRHG